jgi:hypothetical protein
MNTPFGFINFCVLFASSHLAIIFYRKILSLGFSLPPPDLTLASPYIQNSAVGVDAAPTAPLSVCVSVSSQPLLA